MFKKPNYAKYKVCKVQNYNICTLLNISPCIIFILHNSKFSNLDDFYFAHYLILHIAESSTLIQHSAYSLTNFALCIILHFAWFCTRPNGVILKTDQTNHSHGMEYKTDSVKQEKWLNSSFCASIMMSSAVMPAHLKSDVAQNGWEVSIVWVMVRVKGTLFRKSHVLSAEGQSPEA